MSSLALKPPVSQVWFGFFCLWFFFGGVCVGGVFGLVWFFCVWFFWEGKYPRSFMCYNMFIQWFQASKCPHSVVLLWLAPITLLLCMNALYLPLALGSLMLFRQCCKKEIDLFFQCVHWTRWQCFTACLKRSKKSGDSVDCIHITPGLALRDALFWVIHCNSRHNLFCYRCHPVWFNQICSCARLASVCVRRNQVSGFRFPSWEKWAGAEYGAQPVL